MALESFKDLYNIVKDHLNLPSLPDQPSTNEFDDMTICLSWWKHIVYKIKSDEIEAHLIFTNVPTSKASEAFQDQEYDLVMLVFDTTDMSSLDECQKLEREHLRKDIPRVYVAANMDKLPEEKKRVLQAAAKHCIVNELEGQPLLFSESDDVDRYLDHLARSCLRERGIAGLQSSPYEAQKRRRDQLVQGIGLSVLVVIGVGLCSLALFKNWFFSSPSGAVRKK